MHIMTDLAAFATTHVGLVRTGNEDAFVADPDLGVWAVADGMGGHHDGAAASQILADALAMVGTTASIDVLQQRFEQCVTLANDRIREVSRARDNALMGTTLAALLTRGNDYVCGWAGDSRVYLRRGDTLIQLTRDHSEAQELLDQGVITAEQASAWPRRNAITRAVGVKETIAVDTSAGTMQPGDVFLVCSDGLTRHVTDAEIDAALATCAPEAACDTLIATTLARGAEDNVTIVVVRYQPTAASQASDAGGRQCPTVRPPI